VAKKSSGVGLCRIEFSDFYQLMWSLLKEFFRFSKQEKKWWLIPLIVLVLLLGVVLFFTAGSGIAWTLYPSR
jgi:hypothetical protein